ncbi:hypothetical protein K435DRAFT_839979 [Dendrothele bispora CBS 962.96]|uniref:Uncharacterized protein n=1 Tax=Dendrothele bispora (strain CBS 962.96) TaxID=1314807 RepID=A0A4S8LXZ9_DENBC|nr:hypothetical protein K435DRAFT_839979 [Dendrothele bispora CBS 962.96]
MMGACLPTQRGENLEAFCGKSMQLDRVLTKQIGNPGNTIRIMEPLPYNITLSSQTACSIRYDPASGSAVNQTTGWMISYTDGVKDLGYGNGVGVGVDLHQTSLVNATMELDWIGTAVYLYGKADMGSYTISIDDADIQAGEPMGGLLGSKSGLLSGSHKVK